MRPQTLMHSPTFRSSGRYLGASEESMAGTPFTKLLFRSGPRFMKMGQASRPELRQCAWRPGR